MSMDYTKYLEQMQDTWVEDSEKGGFENVPPGIYDGRLQKCELAVSTNTDKLQIRATVLIYTGEQAGNTATAFIPVMGEYGPGFTKRFIDLMGYEFPADPTELPAIIEAIDGEKPPVRIKVTAQKDSDFVNVNFAKLLDESDLPSAPETDTIPDGDEGGAETADDGESGDVSDDLDEMTRTELKNLIMEQELDISIKGASDDDIRSAIRETEWYAEQYDGSSEDSTTDDSDDGGTLESIGEEIEAFCVAHGIDYNDEDPYESLVESIYNREYQRGELTDAEADLLNTIGATVIDKPKLTSKKKVAAPKTSVKKSASTAKKTVSKSTAKKAAVPAKQKVDLKALRDFADAYSVRNAAKLDQAALVAQLGKYDWKTTEDLTAGDKKLLKSIGLL